MQSQRLTRWVVSTDCERTAELAEGYGAEVIMRPAEYATDECHIELALAHALGHVEEGEGKYDIVVSLQNSNILRSGKDIDNCCHLLDIRFHCHNSVMSVVEATTHPLTLYTISSNMLTRFIHSDIYRRQDLPKLYVPNGAVYAVSRDYLVNEGKVIADMCAPYVMPQWTYLDIHIQEDIKKAEAVLEKHYETGQ